MLDKTILKNAIISNIESNGFVRNDISRDWLDGLSKSIADAVIDHIKIAQVTIPSGSSAGVYPNAIS